MKISSDTIEVFFDINAADDICSVGTEAFFDGQGPYKISREKYDRIISLLKEYNEVQEFLYEVIEDNMRAKWTYQF